MKEDSRGGFHQASTEAAIPKSGHVKRRLFLIYFFFYVDQFLKVFIEFVTILLLFCVLVFWPLGKCDLGISLVAHTINNPPAMQETQLGSPGWEDPPEKGTAPHSSIFAWRIPWTEFTVHGVTKSQA